MECCGNQADVFPAVRSLAGLDGLPFRRGQGGQGSDLLKGPAVPQAGSVDMLAQELSAELGPDWNTPGGPGR
jgi:hypothetical protein